MMVWYGRVRPDAVWPQKTDGVSALWDGDGASQGLGKDAVTCCKKGEKG